MWRMELRDGARGLRGWEINGWGQGNEGGSND